MAGYTDYRDPGPTLEPSGADLVVALPIEKRPADEQIAALDERLAELAHVRSIGKARGEDRPTSMEENALLDQRLVLAASL